MDIETFEAIGSLRGDIQRVETSLLDEIGKLRAETVTRVEFKGEIGTLRGEMSAMREELKRHTDMRFESLRDDIRIVAEGFASLSAKIDAFRPGNP